MTVTYHFMNQENSGTAWR